MSILEDKKFILGGIICVPPLSSCGHNPGQPGKLGSPGQKRHPDTEDPIDNAGQPYTAQDPGKGRAVDNTGQLGKLGAGQKKKPRYGGA
jgi:hypothetical protein